jgi:hypothetical protein
MINKRTIVQERRYVLRIPESLGILYETQERTRLSIESIVSSTGTR